MANHPDRQPKDFFSERSLDNLQERLKTVFDCKTTSQAFCAEKLAVDIFRYKDVLRFEKEVVLTEKTFREDMAWSLKAKTLTELKQSIEVDIHRGFEQLEALTNGTSLNPK